MKGSSGDGGAVTFVRVTEKVLSLNIKFIQKSSGRLS